jgi:two-component system response regulator AtoC
MTDKTGSLLVIDDEENMRHMLSAMLSRNGYNVSTASDGQAGLTQLSENHFDFILCDIKMPGMDGMAFLENARNVTHAATIIMMSAFGSIDLALEAMKLGAYDYISKPFKNDEVLLTLKKAEERERLLRENRQLRQQVEQLTAPKCYGRMIGSSMAMQSVFQLADKVACYDTTVLVTGESGTGKELMAQAIHSGSPRGKGPFVAINCGGIPENLIESELFGYVKGAFTGADQDKKGLFAEAENGTLFLDEIGELSIFLQVKLLRVLQEREIQPIGSSKVEKINARIIAATARDLEKEVINGAFREDLFYRLNVVHLLIPPLRERSEDIPSLTAHFIKIFNRRMGASVQGVSNATQQILMTSHWPGNVRELEHVIEHAMIMAAGENQLLPEHLPEKYQYQNGNQSESSGDLSGTVSIKKAQKIVERQLITRALRSTGGNKSKAAERLEISYPSLLDKIKKYRIGTPDVS